MTECNFAENQRKWDRGEVSVEDCFRKGAEHAAYGWTRHGLGFPGTPEQLDAYDRGYRDQLAQAGD